ncbi:MAG: HAMP domain-containing sensor histidine kinase, partial [Planctomycetota bacterium]
MNTERPAQRPPWALIAIGAAAVVPSLWLAFEASRGLARHHAQSREALEALPTTVAEDLELAVADEVRRMLNELDAKPFFLFANSVLAAPDPSAKRLPAPLADGLEGPAPAAWFGTNRSALESSGAPTTYFEADPARAGQALQATVEEALLDWFRGLDSATAVERVARLSEPIDVRAWHLEDVLHFVLEGLDDPRKRPNYDAAAREIAERALVDEYHLATGAMRLRTDLVAGPEFLLATRESLPSAPERLSLDRMDKIETTRFIEELPARMSLFQGVVYDRARLGRDLIATQRDRLPALVSIDHGATPPDRTPRRALSLDRALGAASGSGSDDDVVWVSLDLDPLLRRHRREWLALHGTLLGIGLLAGWWLVKTLRQLQRQQRRAERIGNFVAAVTHEFRTPLSTIALHAEMLLDGWAEDPDQRHEYHQRIANETTRLSRLVERILEQSQLTRGRAQAPSIEPQLDDLSRAVEQLRPSIEAGAPGGLIDVEFQLAEDLPPVLLTSEAIDSVVTNLVENARKYGAPPPGEAPREPILIRTGPAPEGACLEVLDRGPGIPEAE